MKKPIDQRIEELKARIPEVYEAIFNAGKHEGREELIKYISKIEELYPLNSLKSLVNLLESHDPWDP